MSAPLTYFRSMIHFYTSRIGQWSICMPVKNQEFSNVFRGVHERNIGLNWVKQLRNALIQLQWEHLLRPLQKRTLISKKEQDLQLTRRKSKTSACNFPKKWIPSEAHFKDFCQKIFSLRKTSKWLFPRHYNNLKITVRITLLPH